MRRRFAAILFAWAVTTSPAVAEYEIFTVGLSSWELPSMRLTEDARIDLADGTGIRPATGTVLEASVDRPLWGHLAWLWLGGDVRRATGSAAGTDITALRWRLRLGLAADAVEWVVGLGAAVGSQQWTQKGAASGQGRTWDPTAGLYLDLHRKIKADLGLFVGGGYEWQGPVTLDDWSHRAASGWRVRAGLSWQMPMAWLELL